MSGTSRQELAPVSPRREFRAERLADPDQVGAVSHAGEPDVRGGEPEVRVAEELLTLLDDFPAILERREVPAPAVEADHPQPASRLVEREALPGGRVLQHLVGAERVMAEEATAVHRSLGGDLPSSIASQFGSRNTDWEPVTLL